MENYGSEALQRLVALYDGAAGLVDQYGPVAVEAAIRGVQGQAIIALAIAWAFALAALGVAVWFARLGMRPPRCDLYDDVRPVFAWIGAVGFGVVGALIAAAETTASLLPAIDPIAYIARSVVL